MLDAAIIGALLAAIVGAAAKSQLRFWHKIAAESAHLVFHKIRTCRYCAVQLNVVKHYLILMPYYITIVFKLSDLIPGFEWIPRSVQ